MILDKIEIENINNFRVALENIFQAVWNRDSDIEEKGNSLTTIIKEAADMVDNANVNTGNTINED